MGEGEIRVEIGMIGKVGGREKQITEGLTGHSNYFGFLHWGFIGEGFKQRNDTICFMFFKGSLRPQ